MRQKDSSQEDASNSKPKSECPHNPEAVVEAVDDNGDLLEPAHDICTDCGKEFY